MIAPLHCGVFIYENRARPKVISDKINMYFNLASALILCFNDSNDKGNTNQKENQMKFPERKTNGPILDRTQKVRNIASVTVRSMRARRFSRECIKFEVQRQFDAYFKNS